MDEREARAAMKSGKKIRKRTGRGVDLKTLRKIALSFPGVEEGQSYGTPAFRVRKKLMARVREDDVNLVVKSDWEERENLIEADPEVFHFTEHYANHPYVLVRLPVVRPDALRSVLEGAWRRLASGKMIAEYDA